MTKESAKEAGRVFECEVPGKGRHCFSSLVRIMALVLCGCAGHEPKSTTPEFGSGVTEYKQLTEGALTAVHAALDSLNKVSAHSAPCPPDVIAEFSHQVQKLQIDSLRIRARGQAIQARGDAYFASWSESIARIKDPKIRNSAER